MTNEEFQRIVIGELKKNEEFQYIAIEQFKKIDERFGGIEGQLEEIWDKLFSTSDDVEYLKKKVDHMEVRFDQVHDSVKFIEERTRKDDDALAINFFKLEKRVTKLETQRA